jgi:hypothetical protein
MAFDLSTPFDTVAAEQLAPTLQAQVITGRELKCLLCYRSGGKQCVVLDNTVSSLTDVLLGVRQGLILRLIFFIVLVSGMAVDLGVGEGENVVYADDSNVWQLGEKRGGGGQEARVKGIVVCGLHEEHGPCHECL